MNKTTKLVTLSLLTALSIIFSIVESQLPVIVPGIKLGLSNIIILIVLYTYSLKEVIQVGIVKVLVVNTLLGTLFSYVFFLSFFGNLFAILTMYLIKKLQIFSIYGDSITGAFFFSLGQIVIASILLNNIHLMLYFPLISILSLFTGLFTASIAKIILDKDIIKH